MGVDTFRVNHPLLDGRGVVIGILDSGIDADLPGFASTSAGGSKILDLRDFSGEGRTLLAPVTRLGDTVVVGNIKLSGFGRIARLASPPYYGGVLRELPLGTVPAADLNGNGTNRDEFPVIVAKASSGWFAVTDTDGDRAVDDETPIRDFAEANETFTYLPGPNAVGPGPTTVAVNLADVDGTPILDFFFDNSSHGTHVAGIAAGHNMFGVEGFNGVAPGAQLLGLKIANNARGGISVTGSVLRAMNYAADFAQQRDLPLVLNLSYGVGNELEGSAAIDSIIDEFVLKHPHVLFVISAGNDGPGISTVGFPGSAEYAISVCALFPGVFTMPPRPGTAPPDDFVAWWSARGGELAKPDLCAPGVAYSNVPRWHTGEEIQPGTSFAAPQVAGVAALLQSATVQRGRKARAIDLTRALMNTAVMPHGANRLDAGAGVPNIGAAYRWLMASHQAGLYSVRALPDGDNTSRGTAAYRRSGLAPGDTLQRFEVTSVGGQPAAQLQLESDVAWITHPPVIEPRGRPVTIPLRYEAAELPATPGVHVGTVSARPVTDTTAGPSFSLVNTVVVPHSHGAPFSSREELDPGEQQRYFFEVPQGSGGLNVRFRVSGVATDATLYLFEPSGQPQRGTSSVVGMLGSWANIDVSGDDLLPGVYEAVVVAPPAAGVEYEIETAVPTLSLTAISDGPAVTARNTSTRSVTASITAMVTGAVLVQQVGGEGSTPYTIRVPQPPWAERMVLEVELPPDYWPGITDFGVTLFDTTGAKLVDNPLNYALGRQKLALDTLDYGGDLLVELLPAYAHLQPQPSWTGELRVEFLLREPLPLDTTAAATEQLRLASLEEKRVSLPPVPAGFILPRGFDPVVEVIALTSTGLTTVRRGRVTVPQTGS
jgi:subtilisin family serine protease